MGFSKRLWEEEMERKYHTSDDTVCAECFRDSAICDFITDHIEFESCSVCGRNADEPIFAQADLVLEFILEKVNEHFVNAYASAPFDKENWQYLVQTWDTYDLVFDEFANIAEYKTLQLLYSLLKDDGPYCKRAWQMLSRGEGLTMGWDNFCDAVKHETRFLFFSDKPKQDDNEPYYVSAGEMLEQLGDLLIEVDLIRILPAGTEVFRARRHESGKAFTKPGELGPPPTKYAKNAGRMNAPGISAMYASLDRETAFAEVTGSLPAISLGRFQFLSDCIVVDLTEIPAVPSIFEDGPREQIEFLRRFAEDISQPFTPDTEVHIEYVPTQVVSEYLRHRFITQDGKRVRGVLYRSAKNGVGKNLVLFVHATDVKDVPSDTWHKGEPLIELVQAEEA